MPWVHEARLPTQQHEIKTRHETQVTKVEVTMGSHSTGHNGKSFQDKGLHLGVPSKHWEQACFTTGSEAQAWPVRGLEAFQSSLSPRRPQVRCLFGRWKCRSEKCRGLDSKERACLLPVSVLWDTPDRLALLQAASSPTNAAGADVLLVAQLLHAQNCRRKHKKIQAEKLSALPYRPPCQQHIWFVV